MHDPCCGDRAIFTLLGSALAAIVPVSKVGDGKPAPKRRESGSRMSGAVSPVTSGRLLNPSGMPLFEFACQHCGHRFETLVMTGNRTPECPECRSADLEKLASAFGARTSGGRATNAARSPFT